MLATQLKILRVFGLPSGEVAAVLRDAKAEGCPGLRLLERDGDFAICIQVSAPNQAMAAEHCEKWAQKLRARFGDSVYGVGEISLPQATLNALVDKRRLVVAADATTGRLLGEPLRPLPHSEAVFDFGTESWANDRRAAQITEPPGWLSKFGGDAAQLAASRALNALHVGGGDYGAVYMPAAVGSPPFVLVCDRRTAWACTLRPDLNDAAIGNTLLDLLRRRALGLRVGAGTVVFRPGHDRVQLPEAGELGSTLRFSLRRTRPKTAPEAFEPMLDFGTAPQEPEEKAPPRRSGTPIRRTPQASVLDEEVPDFHLDAAAVAVAQAADDADEAAGHSRSTDDFRRAASQLFADGDEAETEAAPPHSRSLDNIERAERRQRRTLALLLVFLLLAVCCAAAGIWWFFRNDLGTRPSPKSYGTAAFDETAGKYLGRAMEKYPGVVGYLAFPGQNGSFVYPQGAAAQDGSPLVTFAGDNYLAAAMPSNTVLRCEGDTLAGFAAMDTVQENSGFTLYMPGEVYRFKILAVYYTDPAEQDGFTGAAADLSAYYDYIAFVTGVKARSLFDTAIEVGDNARFLTLTSASAEEGIEICVTGRLVEADESAQLVPSAINQAADPLLTNAQYRRDGREAPALISLLSTQLGWYANQNVPAAEPAQESAASGSSAGIGDFSGQIDALDERTQALLARADQLLAGLTDVAGSAGAVESDLNKGAEGSLPEQIVTIDQIATPAPTEAPTQAPPESDSASGSDAAPTPTEAPTQAPAPAAETIKVTMNGVAQEMDLVQCLAMVAQNELGPNAPAEAYKAQCVATHCWIISQSGYPSVLGSTPSAAALAAAQEVARVLVTYNGQVCFTPYFASASTGTASSKDVWGGERAWLQAVDSPYDQQVATHWNTNGATSGTARFARQTLQDRIQEKLGIDLSGVDPNQWFTIVSANPYGWVVRIQIGPDSANTYTGTWFRESLLAGQSVDGRSLRSQCFTVSYDAGLDCFIFDVYGYGHGCGMSQWGAIGYARNGWDYQSILTHYFTGTTITTY